MAITKTWVAAFAPKWRDLCGTQLHCARAGPLLRPLVFRSVTWLSQGRMSYRKAEIAGTEFPPYIWPAMYLSFTPTSHEFYHASTTHFSRNANQNRAKRSILRHCLHVFCLQWILACPCLFCMYIALETVCRHFRVLALFFRSFLVYCSHKQRSHTPLL